MNKVVLDETGAVWETVMNILLMHDDFYIIALRGAGSFNGISISDANRLLDEKLFPHIESYLRDKNVALMFDGDNDDLQYPDIGYIAGRIQDHFGKRVRFYAVQMLGWYHYRHELPDMRPLHTAKGYEYRTLLFPDKKFEGEHSHFTQNARLVKSCMYEQWYVGACGRIAHTQLADYNAKAEGSKGEHIAYIFPLPVSVEQEKKIRYKLATSTDEDQRSRLAASLEQRMQNPYGLLCDMQGNVINLEQYQNLQIQVIR